jgi:hypothetical protein
MRNKILCKILFGLLLIVTPISYAQNVSFNSSSNPPNASAVLDLSGCTNGGFLLPWMTTAQMTGISSPANSLLVFNSSNDCYYAYYSGSSNWVQCYCLCSGAPSVTGATLTASPSGTVNPGTTVTYSITGVTNNPTTYSWSFNNTADTIITGAGTATVTADIGCGGSGTLSVTASNSCGSSAAKTATVTANAGAPSNFGSGISGSSSPTAGSVQTYTIATTTGAVDYEWTISPSYATINSGQGTNSISVTVSSCNVTFTLSVTAYNNCGNNSARTKTITTSGGSGTPPSTPGAISGSTSFCPASVQTYSVATVAGATTYNWTLPSGCTITSGSGTKSITVSMGSVSGTISVTASNACGTSNAQSEALTTGSSTVTLDADSKSGVGTHVFTITTHGTNELVVVGCNGYVSSGTSNPVNFTGSVAITGTWTGAATYYNKVTNEEAEVAVYWFVAPTAGTYTITVTETGYTEYDNFACALTGFCSTPGVSDFVAIATNTSSCYGSCYYLSTTISEATGSYALGFWTDYWRSTGDVEWDSEDFDLTDNNTSGHDDYSMSGQAITSGLAGSNTLGVTEGGSAYIDYAVILYLDIQ